MYRIIFIALTVLASCNCNITDEDASIIKYKLNDLLTYSIIHVQNVNQTKPIKNNKKRSTMESMHRIQYAPIRIERHRPPEVTLPATSTLPYRKRPHTEKKKPMEPADVYTFPPAKTTVEGYNVVMPGKRFLQFYNLLNENNYNLRQRKTEFPVVDYFHLNDNNYFDTYQPKRDYRLPAMLQVYSIYENPLPKHNRNHRSGYLDFLQNRANYKMGNTNFFHRESVGNIGNQVGKGTSKLIAPTNRIVLNPHVTAYRGLEPLKYGHRGLLKPLRISLNEGRQYNYIPNRKQDIDYASYYTVENLRRKTYRKHNPTQQRVFSF